MRDAAFGIGRVDCCRQRIDHLAETTLAVAQDLFRLLALEKIGGLAHEDIETTQIVLPRRVRSAPVRGDHT